MPEVEEKTRWRRRSVPSDVKEHMRAAREERRAAWKSLVPESFWVHQKAARRETLLAMRSLIDAALNRLEEKKVDEPATPVSNQGGPASHM